MISVCSEIVNKGKLMKLFSTPFNIDWFKIVTNLMITRTHSEGVYMWRSPFWNTIFFLNLTRSLKICKWDLPTAKFSLSTFTLQYPGFTGNHVCRLVVKPKNYVILISAEIFGSKTELDHTWNFYMFLSIIFKQSTMAA